MPWIYFWHLRKTLTKWGHKNIVNMLSNNFYLKAEEIQIAINPVVFLMSDISSKNNKTKQLFLWKTIREHFHWKLFLDHRELCSSNLVLVVTDLFLLICLQLLQQFKDLYISNASLCLPISAQRKSETC